MTFTKTSQKFGQWSDARANTVFGLGFPSEAELNKVGRKTSSEFSPCMQPYDKSAVNLYLVILTILFPGSLPLPLGKRETEVKVYYASHS